MRILLIAPLHRQIEYYSKKRLTPFLPFQGQQSWITALKNLGHGVSIFKSNEAEFVSDKLSQMIGSLLNRGAPTIFSKYMNSKNKLYNFVPANYIKNAKLIHAAEKFRPQMILLSGGTTEIFPSSLRLIKKKFACKIYLMSGVNPAYAATRTEKLMVKQLLIDLVVENDRAYAKSWEKLGVKSQVLPISSVNPMLHKKINLKTSEKKEFGCGVCFIGTLNKDRQKILVNLSEFDLKIWGDIPFSEKLDARLKPLYLGYAHDEKMVKIFNAAKIVLNFQPKDMNPGGNMRSFEIPGCCAFQLANSMDTSWFVPGREIVLFKDLKDLREKIKYYLQHDMERIKIARSGYQKARKYHTYEKHFSKLL